MGSIQIVVTHTEALHITYVCTVAVASISCSKPCAASNPQHTHKCRLYSLSDKSSETTT